MNLQVMEALGIAKAFVLGTSQGGWITARMALLAPDKILGILPLGTSLDPESPPNPHPLLQGMPGLLTPYINSWTPTPNPSNPNPKSSTLDFFPLISFTNDLIDIGFGHDCDDKVRDFWTETIKGNYRGDEGWKRIRMAGINLRDRDGLHGRVGDVTFPVRGLHGSNDAVYSLSNAQEEIKLFTNAKEVELVTLQGDGISLAPVIRRRWIGRFWGS